MTQDRLLNDNDKMPLLTWADGALALSEAGHAVFARLLPPAAADRLADRLGSVAIRLRPRKRQQISKRYLDILGRHAAGMPSADVYAQALIATFLRSRMFLARLAANPAWRPEISVEGKEAVEAALGEGRGIVIWMAPQELNPCLVRMVCHDYGWGLHHISHWKHGPSVSRLGLATFNRRDCRIEDRLSGRLVLTGTDTTTALAQADSLLKAGGMVSFRGIGWSQRPIVYPLFDGHMQLGLGAPVTAKRAGSALFSVAAAQQGTGYRLSFRQIAMTKGRALEEAGQEFATHLEQAFRAAPFLWNVTSEQWTPGAPPVPFGKRLRAS